MKGSKGGLLVDQILTNRTAQFISDNTLAMTRFLSLVYRSKYMLHLQHLYKQEHAKHQDAGKNCIWTGSSQKRRCSIENKYSSKIN